MKRGLGLEKFLSTYNERQDVKRKIKALSMVFFYPRRVVLQEWLPQGQTVTSVYYCLGVTKRQRERVCSKNLICGNISPGCFIMACNLLSHSPFIVKSSVGHKRLLQCLYTLINQLNWTHVTFLLFPEMKENFKRQNFQSLDDVKQSLSLVMS